MEAGDLLPRELQAEADCLAEAQHIATFDEH
jgi:hypothetical protein